MSAIVLVTGGSRGIGAATARLAAARGYDVAINYVRDKDAAERLRGEIAKTGRRAVAVQGDVASEADVGRIFETVDRELGRLDALANNAGITGRAGRLDEATSETIRRVIDVNVNGALYCAREAVRRMSTKHGGKGGTIVNLSSMAAVLGGGGSWIPYGAAKGAVSTMTIGLAREVAAEGIRVNAVCPGLIDTEIHAAAGLGDRLKQLAPTVPMQRIGTADEVAQAILWLMSDESAYVTGAILPISGGR